MKMKDKIETQETNLNLKLREVKAKASLFHKFLRNKREEVTKKWKEIYKMKSDHIEYMHNLQRSSLHFCHMKVKLAGLMELKSDCSRVVTISSSSTTGEKDSIVSDRIIKDLWDTLNPRGSGYHSSVRGNRRMDIYRNHIKEISDISSKLHVLFEEAQELWLQQNNPEEGFTLFDEFWLQYISPEKYAISRLE